MTEDHSSADNCWRGGVAGGQEASLREVFKQVTKSQGNKDTIHSHHVSRNCRCFLWIIFVKPCSDGEGHFMDYAGPLASIGKKKTVIKEATSLEIL